MGEALMQRKPSEDSTIPALVEREGIWLLRIYKHSP